MISTIYHSPLGDLVLKADARGLVSLRFVDAAPLTVDGTICAIPGSDALSGGAGMVVTNPADTAAASVLSRAWAWLNAYFAGQAPCWLPPLHMEETAFSHAVWSEALAIPAGEVVEFATFARCAVARPGALDDGVPLGAAVGSGIATGFLGAADEPREGAFGDAFERADGYVCGCTVDNTVDGALARAVSHALAMCPVAVMVPCHRVAGAPVSRTTQLRVFEQGSHCA